MRRAGDQHNCIRHQEAAEFVGGLIRINHLHGLMLFHPIYDVVTIHETEDEFTARYQVSAVTVAGRYFDGIVS